ncbi:hypothetical protein NEOKW01_0693 [Nematocida sp. AWRm80]|nr:hypothetical protein NEOKW01_0693 [Nematocida sp. AWRm80]
MGSSTEEREDILKYTEYLEGSNTEEDAIEENTEEESDLEEQLLKVEQANKEEKASAPEKEKENKRTSLGLIKLLAHLHKEGPSGKLSPEEYPFLEVFSNGLEAATLALQEETTALLRLADEEMKGAQWKRLNKQKPIKQRIKLATTEKSRKMNGIYNDALFITEITKDYCYKTGLRLFTQRQTNTQKTRRQPDTHTEQIHSKLAGFYTPIKEYAWEEEKNNEFIKGVFIDA